MNYETPKSRRALYLVPPTTLTLVAAAAQVQTSAPAAASARMRRKYPQHGPAGPGDIEPATMTGMDSIQKTTMSGDTHKDFATMMKMLLQQAVEMAQIELAHGKSPAMKAMAGMIILAQQKEIARLDQWLAKPR